MPVFSPRAWIQTVHTKLQQFWLFYVTAVKWVAGGRIYYLCTTRITKKMRLHMNYIYWEWYSQLFLSHVVISFTQSCVSQSVEPHPIFTRVWLSLVSRLFYSHTIMILSPVYLWDVPNRCFKNIQYIVFIPVSMCPKLFANSSPKSVLAFLESVPRFWH